MLFREKLEPHRTPEEVGFRRHFNANDLVHPLRILGEKGRDWKETLWLASLDLEKAFDKVFHDDVFEALQFEEVDDVIIAAIRELYADQWAYVFLETSVQSRDFEILRGVRQGDPMSPDLFSTAIRHVMRKLKTKWEAEARGTIVGSDHSQQRRLTYMMFADDTTVVAKSRQALTIMLRDLRQEFAKVGLVLNPSKCKVQTNASNSRSSVFEVDGMKIPIVDGQDGFVVLGVCITCDGRTSKEFQHRCRAAWAKFYEVWPLLKRRDSSLKKRCLLFNATVSKSLLWCSATWTLTAKEKRHLRAVQRTMLRKFAGPRRGPEEEYITWIKRATKVAENRARQCGVQCWLKSHLLEKWRWAGGIVAMGSERWAQRLTFWRDSLWWSTQQRGTSAYDVRPMRRHGNHTMRWEDEIRRFCDQMGLGHWRDAAENRCIWESFEEMFVSALWR